MAIKQITLNKTLSYDDTKVDIVAVANKLGYNPQVVDDTKLDANGNVPLVPKVDAQGNPVYEMIDEVQADGTVKQVQGKQRVEPVDVYIPNPETEIDFVRRTISDKLDVVASKTLSDAIFSVQQDALEAQKRATEKAIKTGITTV